MKFHVWSDLHLELTSKNHVKKICKLYFKQDLNSYLILGGDIGKISNENLKYFLDWCTTRYLKIFYICGNHEFYESEYNQVIKETRKLCSTYTNIYFLNQNVYLDDACIIFGCTLWTNINTYLPNYNDFKYIHNIDINQWHQSDLNWLITMTNYYKNDVRKKIVITHHMPSYELIEDKYIHSRYNCAFANSDCDDILKLVDFWIYGHTHTPSIKRLMGCLCICNPLGYQDENEYSMDCIFRV